MWYAAVKVEMDRDELTMKKKMKKTSDLCTQVPHIKVDSALKPEKFGGEQAEDHCTPDCCCLPFNRLPA